MQGITATADTFLWAAIPSPPKGVWMLGPIPLRGYALSILTGVIVAYVWTRKRYADRGGDPNVVLDALLVAIPAGIVGGRLYHVITDHQRYFGPGQNPWNALKITNGGLGIWGAITLGVLAVWVLLKVRGLPLGPFADAAAPAVIVAQAIGRLGNWFNQELYGGPSTAPWALEIYERVNADGVADQVYGRSTGQVLALVQPTFLYEMLWNLAVAALLVYLDRRYRLGGGRLFMAYVALYTLGRFFIENLRTDPATTVFGDVRINAVVSVVVCACAVTALFMTRHRRRETPAEVRGTSEDAVSTPAVG